MTLFPKDFLWGVSTSAHQIEGGNHNQWTVWELENAKSRAAQAEYHLHDYVSWDFIKKAATEPSNYVSDLLGDHYHHYKEDFKLLSTLNMNAFRFSIEWSRVEPEEGAWSTSAMQHYKDYLLELKRLGIEPVVTLFHFSLPVWFSEKGGFARRGNVKYFVRFAQKITEELGDHFRYVITINEPEIYISESYRHQNWPPNVSSKREAWRVMHNLAVAHKRVAKLLHTHSDRFKVSIAKNSQFIYPGDNALLSRYSAAWMQYWQDDRVIRKFIRHCDFLGVNYYFSNRVYGYRVHNPNQELSDLNWDMHPADIQFVLERLNRKYHKPILITENGLADAKDTRREWWIKETLFALQQSMKHEVQLIGYLHWSLLDNFEWAEGRWPRFGLAAVDYVTGKRILRPSALKLGRAIKKLRGM